MMRQIATLFVIISIWGCTPKKEIVSSTDTSRLEFVDPFIGTAGHGHTFPGATVPFGAVQVSPENGISSWDWCSGYHYSDSVVIGFSHTHLSGTGIGDLSDILLMPSTASINLEKEITNRLDYDYRAKYNHDDEKASPGFYWVKLLDSDINVSLTATTRCGLQQYDFPKNSSPKVVLDLGHHVNWDKPVKTVIQVVNDTLVTGYRYSTGWAKDQRIYFAMAFSTPFKEFVVADSTSLLVNQSEFGGRKIRAVFDFSGSDHQNTILTKVGISSAGIEGALKSLSEIPHWNFDQVKLDAEKAWEKELDKIEITTEDEALKRTFYTAIYHSSLAPVVYSDLNNEYKGAGGAINKAAGFTRYDIFSLWDTYRAAHPLFTITHPDRVNDMIHSMLAHYDEYGLLPVWSLLGNETNTMTGYHAIPVIADAYFKGFRSYDVNKAYEAMKASAMQDIRGVQFYKTYGFIPSDKEVESVTKNLEYAFDDWCIAQMAKSLGKAEDFDYFQKRSQSYKLLFDSLSGFMRGKLSDGTWRKPFDPKRSEHRVNTDYTEGNAWQHTWYVPHDVPGLVELMGGRTAFNTKLDSLFSISSAITGDNVSVDISGLIGQYAHGNEPSHHVAYLYNYAGSPWKTQEMVTQILETQYSDKPDGLCGNDDCGQMSAWYIFSTLGFYPVNPASGVYVIGKPMFEKATIKLDGDRSFTIIAKELTKENIYIQSVQRNGKPYNKPFVTHEDLMKGGTLTFEMGSEPNKDWGTDLVDIPNFSF